MDNEEARKYFWATPPEDQEYDYLTKQINRFYGNEESEISDLEPYICEGWWTRFKMWIYGIYKNATTYKREKTEKISGYKTS